MLSAHRSAIRLSASLAFAVLAIGVGPGALPAQTLGTQWIQVSSASNPYSVVLSATGTWTATANDSWLHVGPSSVAGNGSANVVFTVDAFTGIGTRTGTLTIAGLSFAVTQRGTNFAQASAVSTVLSSSGNPQGIAVDSSGEFIFSDTATGTIKRGTTSVQVVLVGSLGSPAAIALDSAGNVYYTDSTGNKVG